MNILIETKATWHIYRGLIIYCGAKKLHPFYFLSNFKSRSSLITFGAENEYKRKQFQNYPPLLMNYECHYTTLWNTTCLKLFITTTVQALIVMINWQLRTNSKTHHNKCSKCLPLALTRAVPGSGTPCTSRTAENVDAVNDLALSQEGAPGTHKTTVRSQGKLAFCRGQWDASYKDIQRKCLKKRS